MILAFTLLLSLNHNNPRKKLCALLHIWLIFFGSVPDQISIFHTSLKKFYLLCCGLISCQQLLHQSSHWATRIIIAYTFSRIQDKLVHSEVHHRLNTTPQLLWYSFSILKKELESIFKLAFVIVFELARFY